MDETIFRGYYQPSGFNWLIWKFIVADNEVRSFLHIDRECGIITSLIITFTFIILTYSFLSTKVAKSNETLCRALQSEASEKLPRKRSILSVRPAYNCIHKHLQQTDVFQEKARRTLHKENLEVELMKSRISCMNKLLQPETGGKQRLYAGGPLTSANNPWRLSSST